MEPVINEENVISHVKQNTIDITKLKSNVKWIYQYGGVGGTGSGGGGETKTWGVYATLDGQILKSGVDIILDPDATHNFYLLISNANGLIYTIKSVKFYNGIGDPETDFQDLKNFTSTASRKLSPGNYEYTWNGLNIKGNAKFEITVDCDDNPDPQTISCFVVCNPFSVTAKFQENISGTYKDIADSSAIYVSSLQNLYLTVNYTLYTSANSTSKLIFNNCSLPITNLPENNEQLLTSRTGKLIYEISEDILTNSSYYGNNIVDMNIVIESGSKPKIIDISTSCVLIPDGLFLRVYSGNRNNIYNNIRNISQTKSFSTGLVQLNITGYYGSPNARFFDVSCITTKVGNITDKDTGAFELIDNYTLPTINDFKNASGNLDNSKNKLNLSQIKEMTSTGVYLSIENAGIYALSFILKSSSSDQIVYSDIYTYYIYVSASKNSVEWIENIEIEQLDLFEHNKLSEYTGAISKDFTYYYRFGECTNNVSSIKNSFGNYISMSNNSPETLLVNLSKDSGQLLQYVINIGIQYDIINDEQPILKLHNEIKAGNNDITVYQNKVLIGSKDEIPIYLPMSKNYDANDTSKYNLLSIVRQKMSNSGYAYNVYINGILENALGGAWHDGISYTKVTLYSGNYSINLLDVTNISDTIKIVKDNSEETVTLTLPDYLISEYYLKYASNIYTELNNNLQKSVDTIKMGKYFIFEDNKIFVKGGISILQSLKKELKDVPMMLLDFTDAIQYSTVDEFFNVFLFPARTVNNVLDAKFNTLYYNNFNIEEKGAKIKIPNGYWSIKHQGSSTLGYKIKNFELEAHEESEDNVENGVTYIFSPNFDSNNTNSFLPEKSFTLKADEMDSSHCNNTSIGLFVNTNTEPYQDVHNINTISSSKYNSYVKNCLLGFPCMIFVQLNNGEDVEIYYLGIYNFNLGRESYYNLGYKDINILDHIHAYDFESNNVYDEEGLRDGFNIYNISSSAQNTYLNSLCVAEIQGNDSIFDFSQYDQSILFDKSNKENNFEDKKYMLGDIVPKYSNATQSANQRDILSNFIKSISAAGGFIFDTIGKGMSNSPEDNYGYKESYQDPITKRWYTYGYKAAFNNFPEISRNMVPNYRWQAIRTIDNDTQIYTWNNNSGTPLPKATENDLVNVLCDTMAEGNVISKRSTLDYRSVVEYYTICMAFGMVDSVQKNLNIKSWTANPNDSLGARFYACFYDMDTSNGKYNDGSKTNRFAFSDYWVTLHKNTNILEQTNIFKDFYPDHHIVDGLKPGFDTSSSYLFAIAKYASLFTDNMIDGVGTATNKLSPEALWAKFRQVNGPLRTAKHFIENYFSINIDKIPIEFLSLNYRFKYLQLAKNEETNAYVSYDTETLPKFSGTGRYYAEDWLNDRFHILDAYFNLQKENKAVRKYKEEYQYNENVDFSNITSLNDLVENVRFKEVDLHYNNNGSNTPEYAVGTNNTDIYVINHIFNSSPGTAIKSSSMSPFSIKALDMSPLIIRTTNEEIAGSYVLINSEQNYNIGITKSSNEDWLLGGSQNWVELDNIYPFINNSNDGTFYINSDKIQSIKGDRGTCSKWDINCKSLKTLELTSSSFGGSLKISTIDDQTGIYWKNLNTINISGSKILLECVSSNCKTINISKTESENGTISIVNCQLLETLNLNNINVNTLEITPIHTKTFNLSDCLIKNLTISPKYKDSSIIISNVENLSSLTINNSYADNGSIDYLEINNCPNLQSIKMTKYIVENIKTLCIKNCDLKRLNVESSLDVSNNSNDSDNFVRNIWIDSNDWIHLENFIGLEAISFENSTGIRKVNLPNNEIKLLYKAFYNTYLEYIDFGNVANGTLILCDNNDHTDCSIFYNTRFYLKSSDNTTLNFKVQEQETSLAGLFKVEIKSETAVHNGEPNIDYIQAADFINNLNNKQYVISFKEAFMNQENIEGYYVPNDNGGKYVSSTVNNAPINSKISFNGYNSLKDIECMFDRTKIKFVDKNMFAGIFDETRSITNTLNITNFIDYTVNYIHINAFNPIKKYITKFLFDGHQQSTKRLARNLKLYDDEGIINKPIVRNLMFGELDSNSETDIYSQITELCGFNICNDSSSYKKLFTTYEENVDKIHDIFINLNQFTGNYISEYTKAYDLNEIGLTNLTESITLYNAFKCDISAMTIRNINGEDLIDFAKFISFSPTKNQYVYIQNHIPSEYAELSSYKTFDFYKKIYTYSDNQEEISGWNMVWNAMNNQSITNVDELFSKCVIYSNAYSENSDYVLTIPTMCQEITSAKGLFRQSIVRNEDDINMGIKLDENSLANLPNLTNAQYMFNEAILDGRNSYPFTEDLFKNNRKIKNLKYMFGNSTIEGHHRTYKTSGNENSNAKSTYYINEITSFIEGSDTTPRYIAAKNFSLYDNEYKDKNTFNIAYQFIPQGLFNYFGSSMELELLSMFEYSQFEGYLPSEMFIDKTIKNISGFVKGCKILPQRIGETNKYVLINSGFFKNSSIQEHTVDIFNFNIICGKVYNNQQSNNNQDSNNMIYIIVQDSIPTNNNFKFSGFNLLFDITSILKDYYSEDDDSNGENGKTLINRNGIQINLYYNYNENKEGIPESLFNNINAGASMCNNNLSTLLYGHIMEPGTIIKTYNEKILIKAGLDITKGTDRHSMQISKYIILPLIEYYDIVDMYRVITNELANFRSSAWYKFTTFKNHNMYDNKIILSSTSNPVQIYTSMIDNTNTSYVDYKLNNIYNNYLLMLNSWSNGGQQSPVYYSGNLNRWKFEANIYNEVNIYDEDNNLLIIKAPSAIYDENNNIIIDNSEPIVNFEKNYSFYSVNTYTEGDDTASTTAKTGYHKID